MVKIKELNEKSPYYMTKEVLSLLKISSSNLYRLMQSGVIERPRKLGGLNIWPKTYIEKIAQDFLNGTQV